MLAKLTLKSRPRKRDEVIDALEGYLAELWKNGQVNRDYIVSASSVAACVDLPRADALEPRFHSERGRTALEKVNELSSSPLRCALLEAPERKRFRAWPSATALYLFTHALDTITPVCSENFHGGIPLYLLPVASNVRERIQHWAQSYRDHDRIWLASGELEMQAYRQLADPRCGLAGEGRELCRALENATRKRTYYYLHRYYAHRRAEDRRLCPGCGRSWAVERRRKGATEFARFEFRCEPCRLVSHRGVSCDGERYARIGAFRERR